MPLRDHQEQAKSQAHAAVAAAVAAGVLPAAHTSACADCGGQAAASHHDWGYDAPSRLQVVALCRRCHSRRPPSGRQRHPRTGVWWALRLRPESARRVREIAEAEKRSLNRQLELWIEEAVAARRRRHGDGGGHPP